MTRSRKWELLALFMILCIGVTLRAYRFHDWLHFEIDQTYDFNIVSGAVTNGPGNLPLLGPTAGGGRALRLGPIFYYAQYLSALVFGNTPTGHAMVVLVSSILTIPLVYFFSRRVLSKTVSLSVTALFATSLYTVSYARFSWSPNVLPFLVLGCFYAILRCVDESERHRNRWFLIAALSGAAVTQIHFNAFFTVPAVIVIFLLVKRPRFPLRTWIAALILVAIVYSPMIASDIVTHGENVGFFVNKFAKSTIGGGAADSTAALIDDAHHHITSYFFLLSGLGEINARKVVTLDALMRHRTLSELFVNLSAIVFFTAGAATLLIGLLRERKDKKKDVILILSLWFVVSFSYYFSLARTYRIYPRFFLLVSPLPFLLFGLILDAIRSHRPFRNSPAGLVLIVLFSGMLIGSNISGIISVFDRLQDDSTSSSPLETEDVFPNTSRITLSQQERIAVYISSIASENGYPVYLSSVAEFEPAFWYHLSRLGIRYFSEPHDSPLYREGNYFIVLQTGKTPRANVHFIPLGKREFGSLTVHFFKPNPLFVTQERQSEDSMETTEEMKHILALPTWNRLNR